ncbi:THO complex subunit 2 [Orobanche minor]
MSPPPLECIYLTEDSVKELKTLNSNFRFPTPAPILRFLYELCFTMVRGDLPYQKCKVALEAVEFLDCGPEGDVGSYFADIVTQMAQDITMLGEYRSRLIKLDAAKWLVESALVPLRFFQERCDEDFLWESEMIKIKAADLKSKEVRVNTRLLYQQTKFNLLREESEGYAKLVTLLCQVPEASNENASAATVSIIKSLIGHFDLDPNRVFDIVLECFELQLDNSVFLDLIPIFPKSHASHILGFKFLYFQRIEINTPVPTGLYELTALLVKKEFIDVDSIYSHLLPKDEDAFEHYTAFSAKRLDEANKIGKINLAATGKDLMEDEKQGDVTVDLFAAVDMETIAVAERSSELANNQTLGLLMGFLAVDDWFHAHILLERLSPLNPVEHSQICGGIFRLIEKAILPAYKLVHETQISTAGISSDPGADLETGSSSLKSFIDLPKELFEMLTSAGPYLYRDTLLLQKTTRVLRAYYLCALEVVRDVDGILSSHSFKVGDRNPRLHLKDARLRIEEALGTCLLPSLQLIPANPAVGQEIWELMSLLPYEVRYRLYGEWEKDDERLPMILAARQTARLDTRRILKRLAKENLKQLGRMVAKLAHANPMTVLRTIVHQIEAYRDMIAPVVDAFKYLTQLEYDILEYVVIERLVQGGREKLKDDGLNLSDWLQSLASFWGHLCKKYPSMELRGLFQYLVNQLKKGSGIELVLLQELIQQMANVQYTENMTEDQLDAMAGSDTLRYQATSFGITKNNKALIKSTNRLRDSLLPKDEITKLAIPLLLLIAQHRSVIVIQANVPHIKMVCEQFDRCHGTLLQYVDFLCSAVTPTSAYVMLIPTLDELVHQYHLDPEVAFLIYRPVMRLFRCQNTSSSFWPLECNEAVTPATAEKERGSSDLSTTLVLDLGSSCKPISWLNLLDIVKTMLPPKAWNSLSSDLYVTFWGLNLYDLYVPRSRYDSEIAKLCAALRALEELSDNSSSAIAKRKKEKERIQESLDRLTLEFQKHEEHVESVRRRLAHEKDNWLSSCPDTLKINMEFLQRCVFPRCTFSMPDAVYCAHFVNTLHSLGTPFFNTVNHIDVLICKTLQPMICCCTEYEVGRLGRFLFETLKTAYHWKSDESIYEKECGNMPGFAVYYRYPNSQRVTYGQFIKVHWKWIQRMTRLLIQCLESTEYMEIRNALIMLTKISSVFPVTRKSGINLEKRVAKIKSDEREDLKVLATGVAAALAARKPSWVTDEEFGMGYLDIKPAPVPAIKSLSANAVALQNGAGVSASQAELMGSKTVSSGSLLLDPGNLGREPRRIDAGISHPGDNLKQVDDLANKQFDENSKITTKTSVDPEARQMVKRSAVAGSLAKQLKHDSAKDEDKKGIGRTSVSSVLGNAAMVSASAKLADSLSIRSSDHNTEIKADTTNAKSSDSRVHGGKDEGTEHPDTHKHPVSRSTYSPPATLKSTEKPQKRSSPAEEHDRLNKRRKGENDSRETDITEIRFSEKEKLHVAAYDKTGSDEQRAIDKPFDRTKEKSGERYDREYRERLERPEKSRGDDILSEKLRDRSLEGHGRERSVDRVQERGVDRNFDRLSKDERNNKDDRSKVRYGEEKSHLDDRFHGQSLPPPPPLPPHVIPQSFSSGRRDDDGDRRFGNARHAQKLSPRHEERERRRSEENVSVLQDETKRRREDEFRDRKRDERDALLVKMDERERDKANMNKEDIDLNASKRRKLKREHMASEPGEYLPATPQPPSMSLNLSQSHDGRDRGDRKGVIVQRPGHAEEPGLRIHSKEAASKTARRDPDPMYDREWDDDKRQRIEQKRRHRK